MDPNAISNPEVAVPKTDEMNDADYLNDILTTEKSMSGNYGIAVNEASNEELYDTIKEFLNETKDCARALFDLQFKKGWYKLEKAEKPKIDNVFQEYKKKLTEL